MPGKHASKSLETDLLIGQIALELDYVDLNHLRECVEEQEQHAGQEGTPFRPLGVIMVSRKYITEEQLLELFKEQKRRMQKKVRYQDMTRNEALFGKIAVRRGVVTQDEVNECLRYQSICLEKGASRIPRLGEILVEKGFMSKTDVLSLLAMQSKSILLCNVCDIAFNIVRYDPNRDYRCKSCDTLLAPQQVFEIMNVEDTYWLAAPSHPQEKETGVPGFDQK